MNLPASPIPFTPSWYAALELAYARFGETSRPVLRRHLGPLRVQKHLYAEGPEVCQHIIVHPPGGIAGGDRLEIRARVEDGAWAQLTSPGAAKWYRANGPAYQTLELHVSPGATLEWLPQESIVFSAAQAELQTRIELHGDARLFYWISSPSAGQPAGNVSNRAISRLAWISAATVGHSGTSASGSPAAMACSTRPSAWMANRCLPPGWSPAKLPTNCSNAVAPWPIPCAAI